MSEKCPVCGGELRWIPHGVNDPRLWCPSCNIEWSQERVALARARRAAAIEEAVGKWREAAEKAWSACDPICMGWDKKATFTKENFTQAIQAVYTVWSKLGAILLKRDGSPGRDAEIAARALLDREGGK